ncbi:MAG: hypothetical protein JW819_04295 [Candidatus Krumholzibacteriota bacterium]|nr:hypothetical protein [Candidatus Krumholzibacteriota bacterium]
MSRPATIFLAWLASVVLLSSFLAAWYQSFDWGPSTRGALAGIGSAGLSVALSYFQLRRSLDRTPLVFLRGYMTSLALRVGVLAASGLLVWAVTDWGPSHFLVALGLSYPPLLVLEIWQVQRVPRGRDVRR